MDLKQDLIIDLNDATFISYYIITIYTFVRALTEYEEHPSPEIPHNQRYTQHKVYGIASLAEDST